MGDGKVLEPLCLLGTMESASSFSFIASTGSLLGAGVMLWVDPLEDSATTFLRAKLLVGKDVPLIFGVALALDSSDFFLKKPAMDVWFLELELDLVSEGVGVPRVLFEDLEEGAMILGCSSSYNDVCWPRGKLNARRDKEVKILGS